MPLNGKARAGMLGLLAIAALAIAVPVSAQDASKSPAQPPSATPPDNQPPSGPPPEAPPPTAHSAQSAPVHHAAARPALALANVNLRSGPSTKTQIILTIPGGSTVRVSGCSGEWCAVTWNGRSGFAVATALDDGGPRHVRHYRAAPEYPAYGVVAGPPVPYGPVYPPPVILGPGYYGYYGPRYYGYGHWHRW
jgi:Bacterial SH3 domain